jgi:glycerol-3-phosphate dehydrogenase (NAD(P)+)
MGAQAATFMGLSGLGDLILTCTDNQSRNRRFGLALGQDLNPQTALQQIGQVVEGATTAKEVAVLAEKWQVEMPIVSQVCAVLQGDISAKMAVQALLSRPLRAEEI